MLNKFKKHLWDYAPIYLGLGFVLFVLISAVHIDNQNRLEHGKVEKIQGCEFVKFYTGGSHAKFQYIHNPKCPNCFPSGNAR